jgi:hypothetical protein
VVAAATLALVSCATAPPESRRAVAGDPAAVAARIEAELAALGFRRTGGGSGGAIEAEAAAAPVVWARCPPVLVTGGDDRYRMASAGAREGTARVALAPAAGRGTAVEVGVDVTARYRNTIRGYGFERPCRSTGVVERRLLDAAAAAG